MEISDKLNAIRNKSVELEQMQRRQEYVAAERENYLRAKIKEYSKDFNDLVRLANELQDNGFSLNDHKSYWGDRSTFCTDGIHHGTGFFVRNPFWGRKEIVGFGIECGGAWGNVDLLIDFNGNVITKGEVYSNGKCVSMERFVENFPKFKARFLAYVDEIIK